MRRVTFKALWCLGYDSDHLSCHFIFPRLIPPGLHLLRGGRVTRWARWIHGPGCLDCLSMKSYLKVFHASNLGKVSHFYLYLVWQQFKAHRKSFFKKKKGKKLSSLFKGSSNFLIFYHGHFLTAINKI